MRRLGLILGCVGAVACGDPEPVPSESEDGSGSSGSTGSPEDSSNSQDGPIADGTGSEGSTSSMTTVGSTTDAESSGDDTTTGEPLGPFEQCFDGQFVNDAPFPDYDQFNPEFGSHCVGTNHQDIADVERVVFLGDSVTVGSRPTLPNDAYRSILGDALRDQFGLSYGDGVAEGLWKTPDPFSGESIQQDAGDFSSCAKWGGRNDDLPVMVGNQLEDCFSGGELDLRTLVVVTSGGNDLSSLARDAIDGVPIGDLMVEAQQIHRLQARGGRVACRSWPLLQRGVRGVRQHLRVHRRHGRCDELRCIRAGWVRGPRAQPRGDNRPHLVDERAVHVDRRRHWAPI